LNNLRPKVVINGPSATEADLDTAAGFAMSKMPALALFSLLAFAAGAAVVSETARPVDGGTPAATVEQATPQDRSFIELFRNATVGEAELGELAARKSRSPEIQEFGRQLASESRAALKRLEALVAPLRLPALSTAPDAEHKALAQQLARAEPPDFDRLLMDALVREHEDQVSVLEMEVSAGSHSELKKFAADTLPMVREHLRRAKDIGTALKAATTPL
jgi:putative membrane protein